MLGRELRLPVDLLYSQPEEDLQTTYAEDLQENLTESTNSPEIV